MIAIILSILITISDLNERELITEKQVLKEIATVADTARLQPSDCRAIEEQLRKHPMVREVECWVNTHGVTCVKLSQRIPPIVGNVGVLVSKELVNRLSGQIHDNAFLRENVDAIEVRSAKMIVLKMQDGKVALLGALNDNFPDQLYRLEHIYRSNPNLDCKEIDLRFDGQVVTR